MATKLYKRTYKGRSMAEVQDDVGRGGGVVVRIDQKGDETTAYYEADDRAPVDKEYAAARTEVSIDEVTRI